MIFSAANWFWRGTKKREFQLAKAIADGDLILVERLLNKGTDPNARLKDKSGEPIIFSVFQKRWFTLPAGKLGARSQSSYQVTVREESLNLLLKFGADLNVTDSLGRTVLDLAILWCLPSTVKLLLLNGADPNRRDNKGQTPLMKAAILGIQDARSMVDKLRIVANLLDNGAEVDAQTSAGKTALMYAVGNSRLEIAEFLISSGASLNITDNQGNHARDIISQGIHPREQAYLQKILSQPQLNVIRYKYEQLIPEGDRLLSSILSRDRSVDNLGSGRIPRPQASS